MIIFVSNFGPDQQQYHVTGIVLNRLGATPADTAALGDRLETDILDAQRTGILSLLVLSGVTDRALLAESEIQPDLVFEDIADLRDKWAGLLS